MPSLAIQCTDPDMVLPTAKYGAICVPVEGVPSNVFGLKIPGQDEAVLITKRRTRKWSTCSNLNPTAKKLPLQLKASVWECCEDHHEGNHYPANNEPAQHLPGHSLFVGQLCMIKEEPHTKKQKTRPQRSKPSGIQQLPPSKGNETGPSSRVFEQAEEMEEGEPQRLCPKSVPFDPKPLSELIGTEKPQDDPLVKTLGLSEADIKLLSKASQKMSRFSVRNIQKPWLTHHCKTLGQDKVLNALKDFVRTLRTSKKSSGGKRA